MYNLCNNTVHQQWYQFKCANQFYGVHFNIRTIFRDNSGGWCLTWLPTMIWNNSSVREKGRIFFLYHFLFKFQIEIVPGIFQGPIYPIIHKYYHGNSRSQHSSIEVFDRVWLEYPNLSTLWLTWLNFKPSMYSSHMPSKVWDEIIYPFSLLYCWSLWMDKYFLTIFSNECNCLSMVLLKEALGEYIYIYISLLFCYHSALVFSL